MKVMITGGHGQLGRALGRAAWPAGTELLLLSRQDCDLADEGSIAAALVKADPDIVINAAAYTNVEKAEAEHGPAMQINASGAAMLAGFCALGEIPFFQISTDFVFDGEKDGPYTVDDPVNPLCIYAASKVAGEQSVLQMNPLAVIVRTSWLCGPDSRNFMTTMLRLARDRDSLSVVADQQGQPTFTDDLAAALVALAQHFMAQPDAGGVILHCSNAGPTTWHGFASAIVSEAAKQGWPDKPVHPVGTAEYPTKARRPKNSCLDLSSLNDYGIAMSPWRSRLPAIIKAALEPNNRKMWE